MRNAIVGLVIAGLVVCGCGRSGHRVQTLVEDGTPLVRNQGGPLLQGPPFRLERQVTFGDPTGPPQTHLVSPAGIVEVPGGVAILDGGDHSLKVFNADGKLRLRVGRRGQGPGEFESPRLEHDLAPDGRVVLTDGANSRLTLVDPESGEFDVLSTGGSGTWSASRIAEDRFVIIHPRITDDLQQVESLDLVDAGFEVVTVLTEVLPGRVLTVTPTPESGLRMLRLSRPFWPPFGWWVQGGRIAACQGADYRLELFNYRGERERIVEWDAPLRGVTTAEWDSVRAWLQRSYGDSWASAWQALEQPEHMPAIEGVRMDGHGRIWALRYTPPSRIVGEESGILQWDVIDSSGEWIGTQPTEGAPMFFGRDACYIREETERGATYVRYLIHPAG
jgi:hypothetical protein